ncbi:MAG: hypothetical protein R2932_27395 [Caldilineaceae bacterium]
MVIAADNILHELTTVVGTDHLITDRSQLDNNSRDCYWYSPVLKPQLDKKVGI